jgi:hypothetical protein
MDAGLGSHCSRTGSGPCPWRRGSRRRRQRDLAQTCPHPLRPKRAWLRLGRHTRRSWQPSRVAGANPSRPLRQLFNHPPRGPHGQARTIDHPQNGRAQYSPRARARWKLNAKSSGCGENRFSPRATSSRSQSRKAVGCSRTWPQARGRPSSRSKPTSTRKSDGVTPK